MNLKNGLFSAVFACFCVSTGFAESLQGTRWVTIDDKTGKQRAVVELSEHGGVVTGHIESVYPQPSDTGICSKCPGEFKDKPIKGLGFLWDLKQTGPNNWEGGHILDPKTGKVYRAKMHLDGNKLFVRGFIGISILGRTQTWERK